MADDLYEHPRLAALYDPLVADRADLEVYLSVVEELDARTVVDVGCGTGTFALMLAERGLEVTGVDPAAGSLGIARAKPGAGRVRWVHGDAAGLAARGDGAGADLATMTGNAAQAITERADWAATLRGIHGALRSGGHFVFETRDPARRAWLEWNRESSRAVADVPGVGVVEYWNDVLDVSGPLVTFRSTYVFESDGAVLSSDSTLRFRERDEVEADLAGHGYAVREVRGAPDRPGKEFVFIAVRS
ncbi:MAG TPA: class I SAM-dependent methyltransferase [Actinocrinis sp.]|nr:class I SAM-dependent methyltransferase [Actinocrinis sp.]